nr:unnamed protein product [Haemonchus contortus]
MTFLRQSLISPFATFLILVQVDQMRFCTFEQAPFHSKPYYYYLSFIKYENSSSLGACLKKCVEEMPACVQVAFIRNATDEASFLNYAGRKLYTYRAFVNGHVAN